MASYSGNGFPFDGPTTFSRVARSRLRELDQQVRHRSEVGMLRLVMQFVAKLRRPRTTWAARKSRSISHAGSTDLITCGSKLLLLAADVCEEVQLKPDVIGEILVFVRDFDGGELVPLLHVTADCPMSRPLTCLPPTSRASRKTDS